MHAHTQASEPTKAANKLSYNRRQLCSNADPQDADKYWQNNKRTGTITEPQTDKQTNRQTERQTDRQTNRLTN